MSTLMQRQVELLRQLDTEMMYWLDGVAGKMHVAGVGATFDQFRRGREANRPPCVTLEPRSDGRLMLGLVVSRPKNGKLVYDTSLGCWDFSVPIRADGALNLLKPRHRRVATWGLQLLRTLLDFGNKAKAGNVDVEALSNPRVLIPFNSGEEKITGDLNKLPADVLIDYQSVPGKTLVDSRAVSRAAVARAIDDDTALEDFRPVLGQTTANPFRYVVKEFFAANGKKISLSQLVFDANPAIMKAARTFVGPLVDSGATDEDIIAAAAQPQHEMTLSRYGKTQVVSVESLTAPPEPYAGQMLPRLHWQNHKNHEFATNI